MNDMKFISFASNYYQYPIGKVISAALPVQLKKGFPLISYIDQLSLTNQGKACSISNLKKSAPKQAELLEILKIKVRLNEKDLNNLSPNWRRYHMGLIEKKLVKKDRVINNYWANQKYIRSSSGPNLNSEQTNAVNTIINEKEFKTFLIDGVTGSRKTEVYLHLIKNTLKNDKQCLILVPEIGLTSQFINRIIKRIGLIPHQFHSSCTENEKLITWKAIRDSKAKIVLGTRSAIFSPFKVTVFSPSIKTGAEGFSPVPGRLIPISACLLSPGPLTMQPITARFISSTPIYFLRHIGIWPRT